MPRLAFKTSCIRLLAALVLAPVALPPSAVAQTLAQTQVPSQMRNEAMALMSLCRADYDRLCGRVQPGGGRVLACLQSHASQLSPSCAQAMSRGQALKDEAAAAGVLPK